MRKLFPFILLLITLISCEEIPDSAVYNYPVRELESYFTFDYSLEDFCGNNNEWQSSEIAPDGWTFGDNGVVGKDFKTNSELRSIYDREHNIYIFNDNKELSSNLINYNNPFSTSLWFKCTSWNGMLESAGIIMWGDKLKFNDIAISLNIYGGIPRLGYLAINFNNQYFCEFDSPEAASCLVSKQSYIDNMWHHVVMTYDGSKMYLYVDNNLADKKERISINLVNRVYLGTGDFYHFPGEIDEVFFYNTCLTPSEISQLYNMPNK